MFWNKLKYKNIMQSGRSMVEIIGVLVVVGVLSIGAVSGYKYGMNKYRTIQTINELKIRAVGLMQQVNRGEIVELNMEMGDKTGLGYTTDAWIDEKDQKYFYISLKNVPSEICKQILQEEWELPTAIYVGHDEFYGHNKYICGNDTYAPPMDFEFYADFAEGAEYVHVEETGFVTGPIVQQGCDDPNAPLGDTYGYCHSCDTTERVYVGENGQCSEICSNRINLPNGYCVLSCSSDKPLMDTDGYCHACDETNGVRVGIDGQCSEICSNRQKGGSVCRNKICPSDTPLVDTSGNCHACYTGVAVNVGSNGQCSEVCSWRQKGGGLVL